MSILSSKPLELTSDIYVIPGNTNCGVIFTTNPKTPEITELYLVDSGSTEIDGEYIWDILNSYFSENNKQFKIKALISTHCHPDHVGGHNFLKNKTDCEVWAALSEKGGMESPLIQSTLLWGGYPPHELRTLF